MEDPPPFSPSASAMKMFFALAVFGLASTEAIVLRRSQATPTTTLPPMAWMRQHLQKPEVFGTGSTTPCEKKTNVARQRGPSG